MHKLLGIDIGGTQIKLAAFSADGKMLQTRSRDTMDAPGEDIPSFARTTAAMIAEVATPDAIIGIAAPGVVALDGRSVAYQPNKMHGIEGFDWTEFLKRQIPVPLLNDAHAAMVGEAWQGAAAGCGDVVLLTLGTGVGGAILSGGRLLKGAIGRAGHIGHMSVDAHDDEKSIFGVPGALEPAIGNYTIARRSKGRFTSTRVCVEAVRAGDSQARQVWHESLRILARALVSLINVLDPERIIIGGGIAAAGDELFIPLRGMVDEIEWKPSGKGVPIVPAILGEWAGAYGAAFNARQLASS